MDRLQAIYNEMITENVAIRPQMIYSVIDAIKRNDRYELNHLVEHTISTTEMIHLIESAVLSKMFQTAKRLARKYGTSAIIALQLIGMSPDGKADTPKTPTSAEEVELKRDMEEAKATLDQNKSMDTTIGTMAQTTKTLSANTGGGKTPAMQKYLEGIRAEIVKFVSNGDIPKDKGDMLQQVLMNGGLLKFKKALSNDPELADLYDLIIDTRSANSSLDMNKNVQDALSRNQTALDRIQKFR